MSEISYLPAGQRAKTVSSINDFTAAAVEAGWEITRRGTTYVQATRTVEGNVEQVSVAMINGELRASRAQVHNTPGALGVALNWLGGIT